MNVKNKQTIIIQNASIVNGNKGCVALAYSSALLIDNIMRKRGVEYRLIFSGQVNDFNNKHIDLASKDIEYIQIATPYPKSLRNCVRMMLGFISTFKSIMQIRKSDICLDLGEGDSFSDIYGESRFTNINRTHKVARLFRKPDCFLPQTIGPFKRQDIKTRAIKSLKSAKLVMARDEMSSKIASELIGQPVKEYIDLAFMLPYQRVNFDKDKIHVGLNVSALLWNGGYSGDNQFGLAISYKALINSLIDMLLKKEHRIQVHLISHVFNLDKDSVENDFSIMNELAKEYNSPRITLAPLFFNPVEAKSYISGMDFFVGSRMHATIAAISSGVPVVPMAYSRKFNGLFVNTLKYPYIVDMRDTTIEKALDDIYSTFKRKDEIRSLISDIDARIIQPRLNQVHEDVEKFIFGDEDK